MQQSGTITEREVQTMYQKIMELARDMETDLITIRRDFHKYAEPGWCEMRTSSLIARELTALGYQVLTGQDVCREDARMGLPEAEELDAHLAWARAHGADPDFVEKTKGGFTGVIGILDCGPGPVVAMRFDIDALGVIEDRTNEHLPYREGFCSVTEGVMHACGHDGHAAIGLGVAHVLMNIKDSLHGTVKLLFQPAEEGVRGARAIVENGHLDDVDYLIGSHISGNKGMEGIDVVPGSYGSLATSKYDVYFTGTAAHAGGSPEKGDNCMLAMATAILNLQAIPRHSGGISRINVGRAVAGTGRNVIADQAKLEIEVRGETSEINQYVEDYAKRIIKGAAAMHNVTERMVKVGGAYSLDSDDKLASLIKKVCEEHLTGIQVSEALKSRNGGSEDISYMMKRVQDHGGQASFMRVLTPTAAPAHARAFDFGEQVLTKAVTVFSAAAFTIMKETGGNA